MPRYVVSACLAGQFCRYDGGSNPDPQVIRLVEQGLALPLCPEALSGLPCPRPPCEQRGDRVLCRGGTDVTWAFIQGAETALALAREAGCRVAVLKARSPSCGVGHVYDGTFSKRLVPGDGLWAARLRAAGLIVHTEETFILEESHG
jgi:Uncharacterized conserved protein